MLLLLIAMINIHSNRKEFRDLDKSAFGPMHNCIVQSMVRVGRIMAGPSY